MPSRRLIWPASGSVATEAATGLTNPGNVSADDGVYATCVSASNAVDASRYGNWGWDAIIPAGATIAQVQLEYQYKQTSPISACTVRTYAKVAGVAQANHDDGSKQTADTTNIYDVTGDRAWTRADLLDGTFEAVLSAVSLGSQSATFSFDYLAVTVSWYPGTTTPYWQENFETGTIASIFPAGTGGGPTLDTSLAQFEGARSLRCVGAWALRGFVNSGLLVMRVYVRLNAIPPQGVEVISFNGGNPRFGIDNATKRFGLVFGTSQTMAFLTNVTPVAGQWYRFDIRINSSVNPWTVDWMIDGVPVLSATNPVAANLTTNVYFGHPTGYSVSTDYSYDLAYVSQTLADYPIGPYVAAPIYNLTVGGGLVLGGTSTTQVARTKTSAPAGGVVLGGAASSSRAKAFVRVGGLVLGGTVVTKMPGPTNLTPPVVTGSLIQGQVLTCSPGTWQQSG